MNQLAKLSAALAAVQTGLDGLDGRVRGDLLLCAQLRQRCAERRAATRALLAEAAEARAVLHAEQDGQDDLAALRDCLAEQAATAAARKQRLQDDVAELHQAAHALVDACEARADAFAASFGAEQIAERKAAVARQADAAQSRTHDAAKRALAARKQTAQAAAAAEELQQQVADARSCVQELQQRIAAESASSSELLAQLEQASSEGPGAQLPRLRREISDREAQLRSMQCSIAAQDVALTRAATTLQHRQQEVARKRQELQSLAKTIQALGPAPAPRQAAALPATCATLLAPPHQAPSSARLPPGQAYIVEEPDDPDPRGAPCQPGSHHAVHVPQHAPQQGVGAAAEGLRSGGAARRGRLVVSKMTVTHTLRGGGAPGRGAAVGRTLVLREVQEAMPSASGGRLVPGRRSVVVEDSRCSVLPASLGGGAHGGAAASAPGAVLWSGPQQQLAAPRAGTPRQAGLPGAPSGGVSKALPAGPRRRGGAVGGGSRRSGQAKRRQAPSAAAAAEHDGFGDARDW
ncbi:hypothetical protein HT031_001474 [Scenedesmus sp. PABB004]|nr:hypothetical protein HT031_001474 [Scenedesmus sp. PABB004]